MSEAVTSIATAARTRVRWMILSLIFFVMLDNFADRAAIGIAGPALGKDLNISAVQMGYIFSAFGWAYVVVQLPGGYLLDRFGSKRVYACGIFLWALSTFLQGFVGFLTGFSAVAAFFGLRFLVGTAEAPSFPGNSRIVTSWFPTSERGTASAIFNASQYAATAIFAPFLGWIVHSYGWPYVFIVMGCIGFANTVLWCLFIKGPRDHKMVNQAELDYIEKGGALIDLERKSAARAEAPDFHLIGKLLTNRMMVGIYVAQYCVTSLTYFFLTWFPVYLVQGRGMSILKAGMVASLPAVAGFVGGILGGVLSDTLLRRGHSLTVARKVPIILGMLLSLSIVVCNYVDAEWLVVFFMAAAFFGKGFGALGWALNSDTAPKQITGLSGSVLNTCGNLAAITMPIAIGYIVGNTGSFNMALVYVGAHALVAIFCYLVVVGEIKRVEL